MSVIVYGPQGCGKNIESAKMAKHFGLNNVIEEWWPWLDLPDDTLALTIDPDAEGARDFFEVMDEINQS